MILIYSIYTLINIIGFINNFICTFNFTLLNVLYTSAVVLLVLLFWFKFRKALFSTIYGMSVKLNSKSNIITVIPEGSTRVISETNSVNCRFEFNLPQEQIHEIVNRFGTEITNNVITGSNADYIMLAYIGPLMQSGELSEHFINIFNLFLLIKKDFIIIKIIYLIYPPFTKYKIKE
jgi:hypothetical protein